MLLESIRTLSSKPCGYAAVFFIEVMSLHLSFSQKLAGAGVRLPAINTLDRFNTRRSEFSYESEKQNWLHRSFLQTRFHSFDCLIRDQIQFRSVGFAVQSRLKLNMKHCLTTDLQYT